MSDIVFSIFIICYLVIGFAVSGVYVGVEVAYSRDPWRSPFPLFAGICWPLALVGLLASSIATRRIVEQRRRDVLRAAEEREVDRILRLEDSMRNYK